jgi:ribose transport system substrate-binding protein
MRIKPVAVLCAVTIALAGASACGGSDTRQGASAATATPAKPVRVAVVMASLDNDFYVAQKAGAEAAAASHPEAKVTVSAGRERASTDEVIGLIEDALAKNVDAIAVNGSDTKPLLPALGQVLDAKVPLVLFDAPAETLNDRLAAYVGTDNRAGGEAGGKWLAEKLPKGGKLGVVLCVAGHPVTTARLDGFKAGAGSAFEIVATADAQCDRAKGRQVMEDMISAHPDLDAVFSTSDTQTLGAIEALKAARKDPQMVSFDAQPDAVKAIRSGRVLDASVAWSAKQIGGDAVEAAIAAAQHKPVQKSQMVPVTVVDSTNAADWKG